MPNLEGRAESDTTFAVRYSVAQWAVMTASSRVLRDRGEAGRVLATRRTRDEAEVAVARIGTHRVEMVAMEDLE